MYRSLGLLVSLAAGCLCSAAYALPEGWMRKRLSTGVEIVSYGTSVAGKNIAWVQLDTDGSTAVMLYDGQTTRRMSEGQRACRQPQAAAGNVAWQEYISGKWQMMFFDGQSTRQISSGQDDADSSFQLSGGQAAWFESIGGRYQVVFFDGQATRQITTSENGRGWLQLQEGYIVWRENVSGKYEIFLSDGQATRQVSSGQNNCESDGLQLSDGRVVWREYINNKYQVMFFDGQSTRQLSSGANGCEYVQFADGKVLWREDLGGNRHQVMFFDGQSNRQLSDGLTFCSGLVLSADSAMWNEYDAETRVRRTMFFDGQSARAIGPGGSELWFADGKALWTNYDSPKGLTFWDGMETRLIFPADSNSNIQVRQFDGLRALWALYRNDTFPPFFVTYYFDGVDTWRLGQYDDFVDTFQIALYQNGVIWPQLDEDYRWQLYFVERATQGPVIVPPPGDLTGDNVVDMADLSVITQHWLSRGSTRVAQVTLDFDPGWSVTGQWAYGPPAGRGGAEGGNPDPDKGYTGTKVYGVNLLGDYARTLGGPWYVTSQPFDCQAVRDMRLSFARWLNCDSSEYIRCTVQISCDGNTWKTVWENPAEEAICDSGWQPTSIGLPSLADNCPALQLRWGYEVLSPRVLAYSGWNVDDIELVGCAE
ncbi:MAG: hypothetical protein IH624_02540 [Phycisphaerae bacterium]|nr:hypothetical protein [Phycisphaerae bacterium]